MDCSVWNERYRTRLACRRPGAGARTYIHIYYCCKSFPVQLHDVMVGRWIASYVFIFNIWDRFCCCYCCVLLVLPTTSVLSKKRYRLLFLPSPSPLLLLILSFASILLLLLLLRRDMHSYFLIEVLLLLPIIFHVDCATAAAGACAAYNISTEAERRTGYWFFLLRFCPLNCDASDVSCCCCSWLLLFLSLRLRCFGYGC